jgi:hypothetical protein
MTQIYVDIGAVPRPIFVLFPYRSSNPPKHSIPYRENPPPWTAVDRISDITPRDAADGRRQIAERAATIA